MELDNVCHHLYHLHQVSYYEMMRSEERVRGEGRREGGREGGREGKRVSFLIPLHLATLFMIYLSIPLRLS